MALKPTIFKFSLSVSDLDRSYFDTVQLTVAQHPSESTERMIARLIAYCFNARENLAFTKGLSTPDEPDIWMRSLDDQLLLWVDVGEPAFERLKKASRIAKDVKVYSFNSKSDVWWRQEQAKIQQIPIMVFQFPWDSIKALVACVQRTMSISVTISEATAFFSTELGDVEVTCTALKQG